MISCNKLNWFFFVSLTLSHDKVKVSYDNYPALSQLLSATLLVSKKHLNLKIVTTILYISRLSLSLGQRLGWRWYMRWLDEWQRVWFWWRRLLFTLHQVKSSAILKYFWHWTDQLKFIEGEEKKSTLTNCRFRTISIQISASSMNFFYKL